MWKYISCNIIIILQWNRILSFSILSLWIQSCNKCISLFFNPYLFACIHEFFMISKLWEFIHGIRYLWTSTYQLVNALWKDTISVITKQNEKKAISNVYFIQDIKQNLLNVGQLSQNGYELIFKEPTCILLNKLPSQKVLERIKMTKNKMFPLVIKIVNYLSQSYAQVITSLDETCLWHLRYGHLSFKSQLILKISLWSKVYPW